MSQWWGEETESTTGSTPYSPYAPPPAGPPPSAPPPLPPVPPPGPVTTPIPTVAPPVEWSTIPPLPDVPPHDPQVPPPSSGQRRRWGFVAVGVLAAVAMLAGGYVIYGYLTRGGASSPEAAVETLATAAQSQDPALAASVLSPAETPMLMDLADEIGAARKRVDAGSNGSAVDGTEIRVSRLRLGTRELGDRVARVTIRSGSVEMTAHRSKLPDDIRTGMFEMRDGRVRANFDVEELSQDLSVIVVEQDGGWYVSPALTAADVIVDRNSPNAQDDNAYRDFGDAKSFDPGADSPTAAVDAAIDAISSGDPRNMLAALPSDQGQFGVVYGDALQSILRSHVDSSDLHKDWVSIKGVDTEEKDGPNGTKRVLLRGLRVQTSDDQWSVNGVNICQGGDRCDDFWAPKGSPLQRKVDTALDHSLSVIVRKADGGWKVDPVASILDMATRLVKRADEGTIRSLLLSTSGTPTAKVQPGTTVDLTFDDNGYAMVEIPTKPGTDYAVHVGGKNLGNVRLNTSVRDQQLVRRLWIDDARAIRFRADAASTRLAVGGPANTARSVKLTVGEVVPQDAALAQEVQGTLSAPMAVYRLAAPAPGPDELRHMMLTANSSGGRVTVRVVDDPGDMPLGFDGSELDVDGNVETAAISVKSATSFVVVTGSPGRAFTFRVDPDTRGFSGGARSGTVTVPAQSTMTVPIDLGSTSTDVTVSVSWSGSSDIDGWLRIGSNQSDSDTSYGSADFRLTGTGSGAGSVDLKNLSSVPVVVTLEISLDP